MSYKVVVLITALKVILTETKSSQFKLRETEIGGHFMESGG